MAAGRKGEEAVFASRSGKAGLSRLLASGQRKFKETAETRDGRFFLLALFVCLVMLPIYFLACTCRCVRPRRRMRLRRHRRAATWQRS